MTADQLDPHRSANSAPSASRDWLFTKYPRWVVGHLLVLVVLVLFVNLGLWQIRRLQERQALNATVAARSEAPIEPLATLLSRVTDPGELEYRAVTVEGVYAPENEILVRSRSLNGVPGFYVVTPLVGSTTVLINRGFVPLQFDVPPVAEAAPPPGQVEVTGRVRQSVAPPAIGPKDPDSGRLSHVYWLNVERLQEQFDHRLAPVFAELILQDPAQTIAIPVPLTAPTLDEGPHRSYAIQWFLFAGVTGIGYGFLLRRAARQPGFS